MVPGQVTLIPTFLIVKYLGWIDTYQALIIRQVSSAPPARSCCGSSSWPSTGGSCCRCRAWRWRCLPSPPQWDRFLWPLIVVNDAHLRALTVGLRALVGQFAVQYQLLMAGGVVSLVPMPAVFLLAQRAFVRGIALTGLAGR
jgi:multiple sugar transport system permease protein